MKEFRNGTLSRYVNLWRNEIRTASADVPECFCELLIHREPPEFQFGAKYSSRLGDTIRKAGELGNYQIM